MYSLECLKVIRDGKGNPIAYTIVDANGNVYNVKKQVVKEMLKSGKVIKNLTYTTDNRILFSKKDRNSIILYHGSPNRNIVLNRNKGNAKHDYGKGFYLTPDIELAKEWAVCNIETNGFVHTYEINMTGLKVLDFQRYNVLNWLAELMSHRAADNSLEYKKNAEIFLSKFKINTNGYDIIKGWRADASYFYIAKQFVRSNVSSNILEELLHQGSLGVQFCLKSEKAFRHTKEIKSNLCTVEANIYKQKYIDRDSNARNNMRMLIESKRNVYDNRFIDILRKVNCNEI